MAPFSRILTLVLSTPLLTFPMASLEAGEAATIPPDYTAVYQVLRNDKNIAGVTIRLSHQDDVWTLHGFTHDMHGLADVLNIKGAQTTTGTWQDGRFIPDHYRFSFSLIGYKTAWQANFDWPEEIVTTSSKSGDTQLTLADGAVDPFSLSLNIRSHLAQNQTRMALNIVDEDEIDSHVYEADHRESVDTALGCLQTTRVRRVRENSKRVSMVWYADDYNYVPVLMQHSKKKGNSFRLQIISLDVNGQPIQPGNACSSDSYAAR